MLWLISMLVIDASMAADWRDQLPEVVDPAVQSVEVQTTRAGFFRVGGEALADAAFTDDLLARALSESDPALRAAFLDAFARSVLENDGTTWWGAWQELAVTEPLFTSRQALLAPLAKAPEALALDVLARAAAHEDSQTRAEALGALARRKDAATKIEVFESAMADAAPEVREVAAKALSWHQVGDWDIVAGGLSDANPAVRLYSLDALRRMDPERARALPQLPQLRDDADARVRRAAALAAGE